jgi:hypothetical protein
MRQAYQERKLSNFTPATAPLRPAACILEPEVFSSFTEQQAQGQLCPQIESDYEMEDQSEHVYSSQSWVSQF